MVEDGTRQTYAEDYSGQDTLAKEAIMRYIWWLVAGIMPQDQNILFCTDFYSELW
jgi:hypothetical protein